jgi:hypothetical protein
VLVWVLLGRDHERGAAACEKIGLRAPLRVTSPEICWHYHFAPSTVIMVRPTLLPFAAVA